MRLTTSKYGSYTLSKLSWAPEASLKKVCYAWNVKCGFSHLLYALSTEIHFNVIHYLFTWMSCKQTMFSLVLVRMQRGKRTRSQTKKVVANVYDNFDQLNRHQWTQEPLKRNTDATEVSRDSIKRLQKRKLTLVKLLFNSNKEVLGILSLLFRTTVAIVALNHKRQYLIIISIEIILII